MAMVQSLTAAGVNPDQLEKMFFISVDVFSGEKPQDEKLINR